MIAQELKAFATRQPEVPAIAAGSDSSTYSALAARVETLADHCAELAGQSVGLWIDGAIDLIAAAGALDALGATAVLFSASDSAQHVEQTRRGLGLACVLTNKSDAHQAEFSQLSDAYTGTASFATQSVSAKSAVSGANVILFTSGTSGVPKPVVHNWNRLATGISRAPRFHGRRWLLAYDPTRFAGIQMWLQALLTGGCLCVPALRDPSDIVRMLIDERVEFASATPSFWRLLLSTVPSEQLTAVPLVQITLGGEAVDQLVLDRLRAAFPSARLTHIYASTEMGVCFTVNDRLAGFPADFLSDPSLPCELRIGDGGELEIRSRRSMLGYLEKQTTTEVMNKLQIDRKQAAWFPTGDIVEKRGERVFFVGRKSETINVGGLKVFPADVERCIQDVSGVEQVRVCGMPSSLTGQLVKAEVKPVANTDQESLRREILEACRNQLARHQVPAKIEFLSHIPLNESGKLSRVEDNHAV